jgi:hypothetical protein
MRARPRAPPRLRRFTTALTAVVLVILQSLTSPAKAFDNGRLTDGSQPISRVDQQIKLGTVCTKCLKKFCENRLLSLPATSRYCCKPKVQESIDLEVSCTRYSALGDAIVETCYTHKSDWNICVNLVMNDRCAGCEGWVDPSDNVWTPAFCARDLRQGGPIGQPGSVVSQTKLPAATNAVQCTVGACATAGGGAVLNIGSEADCTAAGAGNVWTPAVAGGCYGPDSSGATVKKSGQCLDPSGLPVPARETQAQCLAAGACSNASHTDFATCVDTCSNPTLTTKATCIDAFETWTPETWTSAWTWRDVDREDHCLAGVCQFRDLAGNPHPLGVGLHDEAGCLAIDATNEWVASANTWVPYPYWTEASCLSPQSEELSGPQPGGLNSEEACQGKDLDALLPPIVSHGVVRRPRPDERAATSVPIPMVRPHVCAQDTACDAHGKERQMYVGDYQQPAYLQKLWKLVGHSPLFEEFRFSAECGSERECQVQLSQLDLRLRECTDFENCEQTYRSILDLADEYNRVYGLEFVWI